MDTEALAAILAAGIAVLIVVLVLLIAYLVFYLIGLWKLFKKAGRPGWAAIIPFYSDYVLIEMVGLHWYWFIISLVPTVIGFFVESGPLVTILQIVTLFVNINIYYNLTKKMNKSAGWIVLLVLFGGIALPILGYGKDVWYADVPTGKNGVFDAAKTNAAPAAPTDDRKE